MIELNTCSALITIKNISGELVFEIEDYGSPYGSQEFDRIKVTDFIASIEEVLIESGESRL